MNVLKNAMTLLFMQTNPHQLQERKCLVFFLAIFDRMDKKFKIEYITLIEVSSTKSEIVMHTIEKTLIERDIDISKTRFCSLDDTNAMPGKYKCLENI